MHAQKQLLYKEEQASPQQLSQTVISSFHINFNEITSESLEHAQIQ